MTRSITDQEIIERPQDSDIILSVQGVSKKFCRDLKRSLFYGVQDIATELVGLGGESKKLRTKEFWALRDVSFELHRGQALGLLGANGSGKTTLLRILSGLIRPDTGSVEVKGRLAPLIALGTGFNPILTGRENVYVNMSILGLSKKEIDQRFEDVVDFAEIGYAINAPVQSYSSGMAARLGFACAVHIEPDILLIDEVLAVGDIKFRMKCYRRLAKLRENGTTFILVSHNPPAILNVCQSAIYLSMGQLVATGEIDSVFLKYEADLYSRETEKAVGAMFLPQKPERESLGLDIVCLCFKDEQGNIFETPISGRFAYLCVACKAYQKIDNASLCVTISAQSSEAGRILYLTSASDNERLEVFPGNVELQMQMPYCCLGPGLYNAKIIVREGAYAFDAIESFRFTVKATKSMSQSLFYQPRTWHVKQDYCLNHNMEKNSSNRKEPFDQL